MSNQTSDNFVLDSVSILIRHGLRTPITSFSKDARTLIKPNDPTFTCDISEIFKALNLPMVYKKVTMGSKQHFQGDCFAGQLTSLGVTEMIQTGVGFRERYGSLLGSNNGSVDEHK
jgi:hypothetical protein